MAFRRFRKDLCAAFCWLQHLVLSHITGYIRLFWKANVLCAHILLPFRSGVSEIAAEILYIHFLLVRSARCPCK